MKAQVSQAVERGRIANAMNAGVPQLSPWGQFALMSPFDSYLIVVASVGHVEDWEQMGFQGPPFDHVSVSVLRENRCPTWEEMCWVKDQFFEPEELVLQYHPPKSEYVSFHRYCLHLWKPVGVTIPLPPTLTIAPTKSPMDILRRVGQ